ncbi:hypothetical protein V0288_13720 [Pannus brasiliensis CCIBt3594]|uniref:Uncharacterized protein n=1 Tax=Pannus brasiliensis CCIBt3594 TaxID=1427578 RepID=A0AAW9QK67_9CHRO
MYILDTHHLGLIQRDGQEGKRLPGNGESLLSLHFPTHNTGYW